MPRRRSALRQSASPSGRPRLLQLIANAEADLAADRRVRPREFPARQKFFTDTGPKITCSILAR
jgi:hypothetical protein